MGAHKLSIAETKSADNAILNCLSTSLTVFFGGERVNYDSVMCYNAEDKMDKRDWLTKRFLPLLALLLVVAITVGIFYFYKNYPDRVDQLKSYGYLGAFIISLTFNASLILPTGNILILSVLGAVLPSATVVGLVGGAGAAIGEITGYMAGYSGRGLAQRSKMYNRVEGWMRRW